MTSKRVMGYPKRLISQMGQSMLGLEAMRRKDEVINRICVNCKSKTTYLDKKGHAHWYNHNGWHCQKCHNKIFLNPKWKSCYVFFKGKFKNVGRNVRTGVCSLCGRKKGDKYIIFGEEKIVRIHIHHIEYHEDDPLKDTVELCAACHMYTSWNDGVKLGRPKN